MQQARSCGVLVVRGDPVESFLLMKHADRWDLPKGHVDPGETDVECALRELEEETGIPADAIELDPEFRFEHTYTVRDRRYGEQPVEKTLIVLLGRLLRDVPIQVTEHESFAWFPWDPPHHIQARTIDPLLAAVERHLSDGPGRV